MLVFSSLANISSTQNEEHQSIKTTSRNPTTHYVIYKRQKQLLKNVVDGEKNSF